MRLHRIGGTAALALCCAALSTSCASTLQDAATIRYDDADGKEQVVHVRRDDFERDLRDLADNPDLVAQLTQGAADPDNSSERSVDTALASTWLNNVISFVAVDIEFEARGLEISDAARDRAEANIAQLELDPPLRRWLVERVGRSDVLFGTGAPTEADIRQFYDDNEAQITACPSEQALAVIRLASRADAEAVRGALEGGASFADAGAPYSTPETGTQGVPQCLDAFGDLPPEVTAALAAATADEAVGPVELQGAYFFFELTAWEPTFEQFRDQIEQRLLADAQAAGSPVQEAVQARIARFRVRTDPRYGTWNTDDPAVAFVQPPPAPNVRADRDFRPPQSDEPARPDGSGG